MMNLVWLFLFTFLTKTLAEDDSSISSAELLVDCENWPTKQEDLKECCKTPDLDDTIHQEICQSICGLKDDGEIDDTCYFDCFLNQTGLLKNEKIDKDAVENLFSVKFVWQDVFKLAVGVCDLASSGSLAENVLQYFNCLNDQMTTKCVEISESEGCLSVQLSFENCEGLKADCSSWPNDLINPSFCCNKPIIGMFSSKCRSECEKKEVFSFRQIECELNCTWIEKGITTSDGKVDFEVVEKILIATSVDAEAWKGPIKYAINKCQSIGKLDHCFSIL